jgi:hypothetical protein
MKSRRNLPAAGLAVALLAGGVVMATFQHKEISDLRAGRETLEEQGREAERLAQENREISRKLRENPATETAGRDHEELLRLRNEATQLPRQVEDLKRLRDENERLLAQGKPPADFFPKASLRDVGQATPEDTVQTYFWAVTQGDIDRMAQCLETGNQTLPQTRTESARREVQAMAEDLQGFRITEKRMVAEDVIAMAVAAIRAPSRSNAPVDAIFLKRLGSEWKIVKF